jgi:DNA-directed RNA polymerase specialized sigma24 family protein
MTHHDGAQADETRLLLRYAAKELTAKQRYCISSYISGISDEATGYRCGISRQAVRRARCLGLAKMRRRLEELRILSSADLLGHDRP